MSGIGKVFFLTALFTSFFVQAQSINFDLHKENGAIAAIKIDGDKRDMSWTLAEGQKRYIKADDLWGLGRFSYRDIYGYEKSFSWKKPVSVSKPDGAGWKSVYREGALDISVVREIENGNLVESYIFKNISDSKVEIFDIAINSPFNDNYDSAEVCVNGRAHAHIWANGGNSAYVCAINMGANPPHLGLVMREGALSGYELNKRALKMGSSNFRGVIMLRPENFSLAPNETKKISWTIFAHSGWSDFLKKIKSFGAVVAKFETSPTIVLGEKAKLSFESIESLKRAQVRLNGNVVSSKLSKNLRTRSVEFSPNRIGEYVVELEYGEGKRTSAVFNVVSNPEKIMAERAKFILKNQQMKDKSDRRYGAFMVYDNILEKLYLYDDARVHPDVDEGAERVGMGIFLARYAQENPSEELLDALTLYADFIRNKLQTSDYKTYSTTLHKSRNRYFNYPWVARFYCEMYKLTKNKTYLTHAVGTMESFYAQFGHAKYTLDTPVFVSIKCLREAGMNAEAYALMKHYIKSGEIYLERGANYPKQEVNFEQSIVAPAAMHLLNLWLLTKEQKWLDGAKFQLEKLEAFDGQQAHYRLNNVAIRHWDAYWFGKRQIWGDTFPHYWTCLSAMAYSIYADATGDESYRTRAQNIARSCLSLFYGNGRATCAYVFPDKVNGTKAKLSDEYANDQDWALAFYLMITNRDY